MTDCRDFGPGNRHAVFSVVSQFLRADEEDLAPPCRGKVDLFFSWRRRDQQTAKALCRVCPRRLSCLEEALARPADDLKGHGVWGGTTPQERRAIRRKRKAAA